MSKIVTYKCLQCGSCCRTLYRKRGDIWTGLFLLPNEKNLFPTALIHPRYGLGRKPTHKGFKILAYQMSDNICPHLKEDRCLIYSKRPIMCKGYPRGPWGEFDYSCTVFEKLGVKDGLHITLMAESIENERMWSNQLRENFLKSVKKPNQLWSFDLKTRTWVKENILKS